MSESASPVGLREQRKEETRQSLTSLARRLTAERGLNGFTLEELCAEVGVSRRTFFNYFPSKESAIVGHADDMLDGAAVEVFLSARPEPTVVVSASLLRDLAALGLAHLELAHERPHDMPDVMAAAEREPQLALAFIKTHVEHERRLTELVAAREGLAPDNPIASLAVSIVGLIFRRSADTFFSAGNELPLEALVADNLAAAEALFAATALHSQKDHS